MGVFSKIYCGYIIKPEIRLSNLNCEAGLVQRGDLFIRQLPA